jgi:hypothetical protein
LYAKVFRTLWTGSLVAKPDEQLVFVFLLANSDADGQVDVHPEVISALTGIGLDRTRAALSFLEAIDPHSRSPEEDGLRIVPLDDRGWGWQVVNHATYRAIRDEDARRRQNRESQAKRRASAAVSPPSAFLADVSLGQPKTEGRGQRSEADTRPNTSCAESSLRESSTPAVFELPLNDNTNFPIGQPQLDRWEALYPAVDVPQTMREIIGWCEANPRKRKTRSGVLRFCAAWLSREQDKGN